MKTPHMHSTNLLGSTLGRKFFSALLAAVLFFGRLETAHAQAFSYAPVTNAILGASLSINFAAMTANPTVGGTTVNELRLWDASGLTFLDLSQPLFGTAPWPASPLINQGPLQTGFFSANISPAFFPVLLSGAVGMTAHLTDTADGVFALDTIQLNITTSTGTILSYYGSPADGFGIGIAPGGNLPGTLPGSLPFTGTGFDEAVSGKFIDAIPEPKPIALLGGGLLILLFSGWRNRNIRPVHFVWRSKAGRKFWLMPALMLSAMLLSERAAQAQPYPVPLTRSNAVAALNAAMDIDPNLMIEVWSPDVDFGSGTGYEGLMPAGTLVNPYESLVPGDGLSMSSPSYFFFVDEIPNGEYAHPTVFVLVDAYNPAPVLGNGITVKKENWWPVVTLPGGSPTEYFKDDSGSSSPPGPFNPDGLIVGNFTSPGGPFTFVGQESALIFQSAAAPNNSNACALVLLGTSDPHFACTVTNFYSDLTNHYGVPPNRIIRPNNGGVASSNDLANAIVQLCNSQPPCDKIFIRLASHGYTNAAGEGLFFLRGTSGSGTNYITASALCALLKKLAEKGVPICMTISSCFSGAMLQPNNWNFPAGSVITTTVDGQTSAYGGTNWFNGPNRWCGSLFPYAFSQCLNANPTNNPGLDRNGDGFVNDEEAFRWVTNRQPFYTFGSTNAVQFWRRFYPAGTNYIPNFTTNVVGGTNKIVFSGFSTNVLRPQIRSVGTDPRMINLNVCNGTGTNKTDFHMIFQGNVTNGTASAWRSTVDDKFRVTNYWARGRTNTSITYDSNRNETMVCWTNGASPVLTNQYIHFGYFPPKGSTLRPKRQWWTPTTNQPPVLPALRDRVPTPRPKILWDTNTALVSIQVLNDSAADGGWGTTLLVTNRVLYSPDLIPLQNLSLGNATVSNLPLVLSNDGSVPSDGVMEFSTALPVGPNDPNPTAVLVTTASWSDNPNVSVSLQALPCNIFRGLTAANVSPDQIHLYGPSPNSFAAGTPQILTAMVENSFLGLEGVAVNYSVVMGSVQFTSGALGGGGTTSSVQTDPSGTATVDFTGTAAGPALIQASVNGMSAFQFLQVLPAFSGPVVTIKNATVAASRAMTLTIAGIPDQIYDIQCSTDLITWHTVATQTVPASGVFEFTDTNAPPNCAFYRAVPR